MKKKFASLIIILLFLLTNVSVINSIGRQVETPDGVLINRKTIYVDDNNTGGPWNGTLEYPFQYIRDAIENATEGDVVYVFNGVYYENVIVDKTLSIIGENKSSTIIDGTYKEFVIHLIADHVYVHNFTIRNSGGYMHNAGMKLDSENNLITECIFYRTKSGIYVNHTNDNEINNCTFHTNGEGIYLKSSRGSKIRDCFFYHNGLGLHSENSNEIKINGCYAHTNGIAFFFNNSSNIESVRCAAYNNNDNQGGFFLSYCSNINISDCNVYHNGFGIKISNSSTIYISNCNLFWNTHFAININKNPENIMIEQCDFSENLRFGIQAKNSNFRLLNNNIHNSLCGIYSEYSLCYARHNWWGSPFGPALFERESKDRIIMKFGRVTIFPWLLQKVETAGTSWEIDYELFNVEINNSRYVEIELPGPDSDNDHVPDWWEEKWGYDPFSWDDHKNLDPDEDGLNNVEECFTDKWDSNPFHKDVFLEFDWVEAKNPNSASNKPPDDYVDKIKGVFEKQNITLHVDLGNLEGGEEIPYIVHFSYADLRDLYWEYFLHNNLNNPRKGIFHYCLVCDYGAGPGFAFVGWNHLDSFQISAQALQEGQPLFSRGRLIVAGALHELGHTFGLTVDDHGGIDNMIAKPFTMQLWKYLSYKSCLNYMYTYIIINFSDGSHGKGDFDDWNNLDFTFFKNTHFKMPEK